MLVASPSSHEPSRSRKTLAAKVLVISSHASDPLVFVPYESHSTYVYNDDYAYITVTSYVSVYYRNIHVKKFYKI